jgi:hypothetical protein
MWKRGWKGREIENSIYVVIALVKTLQISVTGEEGD